jgi:hypothetical protein
VGIARSGSLAFVLALGPASGALSAQDAGTAAASVVTIPEAMQLPFGDSAPRVDRERGELFVIVLGPSDERRGPLSASRLSARRLAEQRGRDSLHSFVDAAAASAHLSPSVLASLHQAIDREARVLATRPRVDGSANLRVAIALARLREITGSVRGLPWSA